VNERIKKLIEQAGFLNKDEESIEYFAELIVRECAGLCSDPVVVLQHWGLDSESK
jgi:hypothetical protein